MSSQFNPATPDGVGCVSPLGNTAPYIKNVSSILFSGWVQIYAELLASAQIILFRNNPGTGNPNNSRFEVQIAGPGANLRKVQVIARSPDASAGMSVFSTAVLPIEPNISTSAARIHIVAIINFATATAAIYINGVLDSTFAALPIGVATENFDTGAVSIGYDINGGIQGFDGKLSDIRVYVNTIWDADTVLTAYRMNGHDGIQGDAQNRLQLRYAFDNNSGGALLTTGNTADISALQATGGFPQQIQGAPIYGDYFQEFRRRVP